MPAVIMLASGECATVSDCDAEAVARHKWHSLRNGDRLYARASIKGHSRKFKSVLLHRFLLQPPTGTLVDHINGDGLDNRRENLRLVTPHQNATNSAPKGVVGLNGVSHAGRKFLASISPHGQQIYLGLYDSADEAGAVYNAAAQIVYGEFARLNPGGAAHDVLAQVIDAKRLNAERLVAEVQILSRGTSWKA